MTSAEFNSFFIEEPLLTFGDKKQYVDPKMGLLGYGPCLYENRRAISSSIRLGIIGSKKTIDLARRWILRCQGEISGKKGNQLLFQSYPGFTRIFGCELQVVDECVQEITNDEINQVIKVRDFKKRVRSAAKLFIERLANYPGREPRPHVVICATPQRILDSCGTIQNGYYRGRVRLTPQEKEILEILEEQRRTGQTTLVPFPEDEVLDIMPEASDLRRIIKAKAMELGVATQLAKPRTFRPFKKIPGEPGVQDDATRAWNFCVALYYKAEGYPWKLAEMEQGTCYVGIAFNKDPLSRDRTMRTSIAQIFTHTGEGLVLRGDRALIDPYNKSPYLSEKSAYQLMTDVLKEYKRQMRQLPRRLVVHKSSRYRSGELSGLKEAAKDVPLKDFLTILSRDIRFLRSEGIYPPLRGTIIELGQTNYLLYTKGWIPFYGTYPGLRVPTPLEVVEHYGDSPRKKLCEEILALTKMNWNSADFCIREPITLAYAREVGLILAYVPEEVIPRPEYLYYM
ncbi:hypothetical protein KAU88_03625 [Candidatus Bathyarchaeota archaeon]|nr:hypothetical protein [Candidatus Bathyarchaeota archaeon]